MEIGKHRLSPLSVDEVNAFYRREHRSVWIIQIFDNKNEKFEYCGGVCLHPSGVILTTATSFGLSADIALSGKCITMPDFSDLDVVEVDLKHNIAMLCLRGDSPSPPPSFDSAAFSDHMDALTGQTAVSILSTSFHCTTEQPFSYIEGYVAFPSGGSNRLVDMCGRTFGKLIYGADLARPTIQEDSDAGDTGLRRFRGAIDENLPLTQIGGFPTQSPGLCGYPVFETTGKLMGLIGFPHMDFSFALTIATIKEFCQVKKLIGDKSVVLCGNKLEVSKE